MQKLLNFAVFERARRYAVYKADVGMGGLVRLEQAQATHPS